MATPIELTFLRDTAPPKRKGPYRCVAGGRCVTFIDGVAYVDHRIFAFVDRSIVDWYCHEDEKHWPLMIVTSAGD